MMDLNHAKSFRDLLVYQKAKKVSREIFEISKSFPKEETYSLYDGQGSFILREGSFAYV